MFTKKVLKYLLMLIFASHTNLSFAEIETYIENQQTKVEHICHESLKNLNSHYNVDSENEMECHKCDFCKIFNQTIISRKMYESNFVTLDLLKKNNLTKKYYSFFSIPEGPPPKKFI